MAFADLYNKVVAGLVSDQAERDSAWLAIADELLDDLSSYRRLRTPMCEGLECVVEPIEHLRYVNTEHIRQVLQDDEQLLRVFRRWRSGVFSLESANFNRLQITASVWRALLDILGRIPACTWCSGSGYVDHVPCRECRSTGSADPDKSRELRERSDRLSQWISIEWLSAERKPPIEGDVRRWAMRVTYRPDLLPNTWRNV